MRAAEVGGQGRVIELPAVELGVELAVGTGVGAAGSVAQSDVDVAAPGRRGAADGRRCRHDRGERISHRRIRSSYHRHTRRRRGLADRGIGEATRLNGNLLERLRYAEESVCERDGRPLGLKAPTTTTGCAAAPYRWDASGSGRQE